MSSRRLDEPIANNTCRVVRVSRTAPNVSLHVTISDSFVGTRADLGDVQIC